MMYVRQNKNVVRVIHESPLQMVATGKPKPFAVTILQHFKLFEFFSFVYGSSLTGENTDKADLIAHLLKERALDPESCLMIGDRRHDIIGAHKNGVKALGVLWGFGSREELEQADADFLAENPRALALMLEEMMEETKAKTPASIPRSQGGNEHE